jgi:hypothetical protein
MFGLENIQNNKREKKAPTVMCSKTVSSRMPVELRRNCTGKRVYSRFMIESSPGLYTTEITQ